MQREESGSAACHSLGQARLRGAYSLSTASVGGEHLGKGVREALGRESTASSWTLADALSPGSQIHFFYLAHETCVTLGKLFHGLSSK